MPLGLAISTSTYAYLAYYLILPIAYIALLTVYGTKIQFWFMMSDVSKALLELRRIRDKSLDKLNHHIETTVNDPVNRARLLGMLEYFAVSPVDLDPVGIISKLKHIVEVHDNRMKTEIADILGRKDPILVGRTLGHVSAAAALNYLYKLVNHIVSLTKRYSSLALLQQLYAIMPLLIKQGKAVLEFIDAVDKGVPIGDGIGPLSVGLLMRGKPKIMIAEDTMAAITTIDGRRLVLIKAEGPASNLGKLDDAVRKTRLLFGKVSAIVTIDAMLRLESEKSGETARGLGVAIGGIGVERFRVEETATKEGIPLYAITVKESYMEAISIMGRKIAEAVVDVYNMLHRILEEKTEEDATVIVVGVGNTLGIGQ